MQENGKIRFYNSFFPLFKENRYLSIMNAYYSILQVPLRVEADEKLSLGLLLRDGDHIFFQYSDLKLRLLKSILPKTAYKLLNQTLKDILRLFEEHEQISTSQYQLIETPSSASQFSKEEYIAYLSRYNNNLCESRVPKRQT